jgi:hypothetical protein
MPLVSIKMGRNGMNKLKFKAGVVILSCLVFCVHAQAQSQEVWEQHIRFVKAKTDFANWGKETNQVIPGLAISPSLLPRLKGLRAAWPRANYTLEMYQKSPYVRIRQWWVSDQNQFEAVMVVGETFTAAKEYLLKQYIETQKKPALIKTPAKNFQIKLGNVCFVTETDDKVEAFSTLDFIRHNVVIMLRAEGNLQTQMRAMAEKMDDLLLKHKAVKEYDQLPDIPKIKSMTLDKKIIKLGEEASLTLRIHNPQDRELRFDWQLSAGGVRQDRAEKLFYQGTEPGQQQIKAIVMNDLGLFSLASAEIEVK